MQKFLQHLNHNFRKQLRTCFLNLLAIVSSVFGLISSIIHRLVYILVLVSNFYLRISLHHRAERLEVLLYRLTHVTDRSFVMVAKENFFFWI